MDTPKRPRKPLPCPSTLNLIQLQPIQTNVDINKCIICQDDAELTKKNKDVPLITGAIGRKNIIEALKTHKGFRTLTK